MIFALAGWAAESWNVATARAVRDGLVNNDVPRLGLLDPLVFLAFLEGLVCESEEGAKEIERLYQRPRPVTRGKARREEVQHILGLVGGG